MKKTLLTIMTVVSASFAQAERMEAAKSDFLQSAANVTDVVLLPQGEGKIFVVNDGNAKINNSFLNLAVYVDAENGWNVFELANVKDYAVLKNSKPGTVRLAVSRFELDRSGEVINKKSVLAIDFNKAKTVGGKILIDEKN